MFSELYLEECWYLGIIMLYWDWGWGIKAEGMPKICFQRGTTQKNICSEDVAHKIFCLQNVCIKIYERALSIKGKERGVAGRFWWGLCQTIRFGGEGPFQKHLHSNAYGEGATPCYVLSRSKQGCLSFLYLSFSYFSFHIRNAIKGDQDKNLSV